MPTFEDCKLSTASLGRNPFISLQYCRKASSPFKNVSKVTDICTVLSQNFAAIPSSFLEEFYRQE